MGQLTRNEVFTLAVQKYSDAVYRAAMHNSRCAADAEDVVQDVYEKLLHYNGTFESEEHLKAWLLRVAITRCRDQRTRRTRSWTRTCPHRMSVRTAACWMRCAPCRKTTATPSTFIIMRATRRRRSGGCWGHRPTRC